MSFRALRVFQEDGRVAARVVEMETSALSEGDVVVRVQWSGINFKDALAVSGRGRILRRFPLNAGIDAAGLVESSADARYREGDAVLVNGMGLGETHDGGFAERLRVPADWIVPLPAGLSLRDSMALGTAGFTAGLAVQRMELNGQRPEQGPIVVTGATGGVGSVAISILAARGYEVVAVSGRPEHAGYLRELGAHEVRTPDELALGVRPLESTRFGGAIDNVGGELLAGLTRHVGLWGQIACIGMAGAPELATSVFPLILRGVSLLGISSANCPMPLRAEVWRRLGAELRPPALERIASRVVPLAKVGEAAVLLMERRALGRVLVDCLET
jgi:acrylyl-CoA reductase (NADPH)